MKQLRCFLCVLLMTLLVVDSGIVPIKAISSDFIVKNGVLLKYNGTDTTVNIPADMGINEIGENAFMHCASITSIAIPDGVTTIGRYAFYGCAELASITIPYGVTTIGDHAFDQCSWLSSIDLPDSVISIGSFTFYECYSLRTITMSENLMSIGNDAFNRCTLLESIEIADGMTEIGDNAFHSCYALTSVTIPDSVITIGNYAFYSCYGLSSIILSSNLDSIGDSAFWGCSGLSDLALPLSLQSIGDYAFARCANITDLAIPESVASIGESAFWGTGISDVILINNQETLCYVPDSYIGYVVPDFVTRINDGAFTDCTDLASVIIPPSVTYIGNGAFSGCQYLSGIVIPDSVVFLGEKAFMNCTGLESATIPGSIEAIGNRTFKGCSMLTTVSIEEGVKSIGDSVFEDCPNLVDLAIAQSVAYTGKNTFRNTRISEVLIVDNHTMLCYVPATTIQYTIPDGVTTISSYAFADCSVDAVVIPDGVTTIGDYAFSYCYNLAGIILPESVLSVGEYAFLGTGIKSPIIVDHGKILCYVPSDIGQYTIPDTVTTINDHVFSGCGNLQSVNIPESVTRIADGAFAGCTKLSSVVIPDSVISIGREAFSGCTSLADATLSSHITTIEEYAFAYCGNLKTATIPDGVASIGNYAFYQNEILETVKLPAGLTAIGQYAFSGCNALTRITIPESVASIGERAFGSCSILTTITIPDSLSYLGDFVFSGCSKLRIYGAADNSFSQAYAIRNGFPYSVKEPLDFPTGVSLQKKTDTSISLSWNAVADAIGYNVYMNGIKNNAEPVAGVTFTTTGLSQNTAYKIIVKATNEDSESVESDAITITTSYDFKVSNRIMTQYAGSDTEVIIPADLGITAIGEKAFQYCTSITSVSIPDGVKAIGNTAFLGCEKLSSISIPESVTTIESSAFSNCSGLTAIVLPKNLTTINNFLFSHCHALESVEIPDGVSSIGIASFIECSSLSDIAIPESVESIGMSAFQGTGINIPILIQNGMQLCYVPAGFTEYTIPDTVDSINATAFYECINLTTLKIPNGVASIGDYAFQGCVNLISLTIPRSISEIGYNAFYDCPNLTIYGGINSYANNYAINNSLRFSIIAAPAITIENLQGSAPTNKDIAVTASADKGTLNAASHTFEQNGSFDFIATDAIGNITTKTVTITNIDKTAPVISAKDSGSNAVPDNGTAFGSVTVAVSGETTKTAKKNDAAVSWPQNGLFTEAGRYAITAADAAGNSSTKNFTVNPAEIQVKAGSTVKIAQATGFITNIAPKTTVSGLLSGLNTSAGTLKVLSSKGLAITTGSIGTGTRIQLLGSQNQVVDELTVVIYGDVNGDGSVNALDLLAIKKKLLGQSGLTGASAEAGNINRDASGVNALDLLAIKKQLLGQKQIIQ